MEYSNPTPKYVKPKRNTRAIVAGIIVVLCIVIVIAFAPYAIVPTGHTGVMVTMGRVSEKVLPEGLHFKLPWQTVIMIDNRAQKAPLVTQAFSKDIQQVDVSCSVNYSVDRATSQDLYKRVGTRYYDTVLLPRIMENVKAVFSKYSAENLVAERGALSREIKTLLAAEMREFGIEITSVAIENVDFTDAFTDAVEAKQVAEQTKLRTETEQSTLLMTEKTNAERAIVTANADAEVARINADAKAYALRVQAEAEATANQLVAKSITPELIKYVQANGWNGVLPQTFAGDSEVLPIINLDQMVK